MLRLFVALYPPRSALDDLEAQVAPHRGAWPGLRWAAPATWHITLAFLGDAPPEAVDELSVRLARAASRHRPMTLAIAGAGAFPRGGGRAKVLWAGLSGDDGAMTRLAGSVAAAGRRALGRDIEADRHPHLTLARCRRRPVDVRKLLTSLRSYAGPAWTGSEIHLVSSHLGALVHHETLATLALSQKPR